MHVGQCVTNVGAKAEDCYEEQNKEYKQLFLLSECYI